MMQMQSAVTRTGLVTFRWFLALAIVVCLAPLQPVAAKQTVKKYPYKYGAEYWRHKKGAITNADRERMAKFTAYGGGRAEGQGLPLGKDPYFRKRLKKNRLEYVDSIENDSNGLQITLVRDLDTGTYFVLPRGSEFSSSSGDRTKDAKADFGEILSGQLKIGKEQYESGKSKIAGWIRKYRNKGKIEVIGHSLGGALAQRIALDFGKDIASVTVFNSPGLEVETVAQALSRPAKMQAITNPDGSSKIHVFNAKSDIVGSGGDIHIPADVVIASGGKLENGKKAAHTQLIFADGVKTEPLKWSRYEKARQIGKGVKSRAWGWAVDRYNNPLGGKEGNLENVPYTIDRLKGYSRALLRQARRKKREAEQKKREKDKTDPKKIALLNIEREKHDIDTGLKPKVKIKPPKQPTAPTPKAQLPKPAIKTTKPPTPVTPKPEMVELNDDFSGSFVGTQISLADGAKIKEGIMQMSISGTEVTGSATGKLVFYKTVNPFSAKATGRYDPASGRVSGNLKGRWHGPGGGGLILATFKGIRDRNGFHGTWVGEEIAGRWTASISRVKTVSWDAYMCEKYREEFIRVGGKCP